MEFLVIAEEGPDGFSAYVPDLPGCVTVGESIREVETNIREAIELYLEGMAEKGLPVPVPSSKPLRVEVA